MCGVAMVCELRALRLYSCCSFGPNHTLPPPPLLILKRKEKLFDESFCSL